MLKASLKSEDTDRLLRYFASLGLSPLAWTLFSLIPAVAGVLALAAQNLAAGLILFIVSGFIDMVDGAVARVTGRTSEKGAFIDGVVDRYVEFLLILGLILYLSRAEFWSLADEIWFMLLLFGSLMTSFVRAYADHRGLIKDPEELKRMGGLLERAERLVLLYVGMALGIFGSQWLMAMVIATAVLANLTALQRILFALRREKA